ncbi:hypothetical protein KC19_3G252200 [Ceratodon purpureus]|uniref:Transglycosylase SLT domain-containing protein n=1 Tax=Ceratodon purpureus TaxID=3225 RepID=A0A8T0IQY0_CERPU|nr:hypothetical protein KC19_3G252200 [Ceratodon purpureus]
MSSLALSSSFCAHLGRSHLLSGAKDHKPLRTGGFGHALSPFRVSGSRSLPERIGNGNRQRVFSLPERSAVDLEEVGLYVEGEGEGDSVVSFKGRNFIFSLLSNSVTVGILAFTVAALALVSRNRRPGFVTSAAESGQVYVLNGDHVASPNEILTPVSEINGNFPNKSMSSRSLFFASTTLSGNEGLTKLENKKIDDARKEFVEWLDNVKKDARSEGVSEDVLKWALEDVTVSKDSVVKKKTMPEVKLTLDDYLKRMVDERRVSIGASRLKENSELLTEVSQKFGVPVQFLVAIWGIETNYGSYMGNWDIIQSLATMGFTEELDFRRKYFRGELLEALRMLEKGTAERGTGPQGQKRLQGSWAGAMGQCQFMPTSFREYAVDFDGDGRKDIWESKPDIFASIANYFKEHGWKQGGPIFQKVQVPKKLDKDLVGSRVVKSVLDWEHKHGVHLNPGTAPALPPDEMASLLMPNGPKGNAYLVCNNFRVILRYNSSDFYGFAVCELARLIQERASNAFPTTPLLT